MSITQEGKILYNETRRILRNAKDHNRLVLFVGAGASMDSGMPSWPQAIEQIASRLPLSDNDRPYDSLKIPQYYFNSRGKKEYIQLMREVFLYGTPLKTTPLHKKLIDCKAETIITTNYDHLIEQAAEEDIHDLKFAKHRMIRIAGVDVRILRLGMAGTLAYELHGDMEKFEEVYKALWDIGVTYGAKKMGNQAYVMNHTEGGFPNLNMHYPLPWYEDPGLAAYLEEHPMEGFWNWNRHLVGSCGDDLEVRFRTPYDVGWGNLVNFNHEFPGKKALQKIAENPPMDVVTLEWNAEDVGEVFASQFRGRSVEPYDEIGENPVDINFNLNVSGGFIYHQDYVMLGDEKIGVSAVRTRSAYYHKMISLGFVKKEYTKPGTELEVLWGRPGTPQKKIRVTVAPVPYVDSDFTNNKYIDVEEIPHYQGK